jgi:hypothetical protein
MHVTYHVAEHDEGWGYRLGDVWSETFADHAQALKAAKAAALRQQLGGQDAQISYQAADGSWKDEAASGGDRPEADVEDNG